LIWLIFIYTISFTFQLNVHQKKKEKKKRMKSGYLLTLYFVGPPTDFL